MSHCRFEDINKQETNDILSGDKIVCFIQSRRLSWLENVKRIHRKGLYNQMLL